ncbi:MAG: hypothetical protein NUV84_01335 [Candidatus Uhrbacteria bacterium]|nr:hypothetical protein [Candidatus Uhrbacteria bacterium]
MPTTKSRLNLSLPESMEAILTKLARRDAVPRAAKAVELLRVAMELEEDIVLSKLADLRDTKAAKFLTHEEVWG